MEEELREKQIKLLSSVLNKNKILSRKNGCVVSKFVMRNDMVKLDSVVIGYIKPKNDIFYLDFERTNLSLITIDINIEKDLNGEKLRLWINNGTMEVIDMVDFDEEEYTENSLEGLGKDIVYDMLNRYDCRPSELAERYLQDVGIEEVVGDFHIQEIKDESFGIKYSSSQDLDSIMENLKEDKQAILFDNAIEVIEKLKKFKSKDLSNEDLNNIGILINKLFESEFDGVGVLEYILEECDLLEY